MTEHTHDPRMTRSRFLAGSLAVGAGLFVGRIPLAGAAGGWTFVDDRKEKTTLDARPQRIVAYTTAAAALHDWGITPVGVFGAAPKDDPLLAGLPWNKVTVLGSVYGEIDIQKLLSLRPDLIVSHWYPPPTNTPLFGFKDLSQQSTIDSQVPVVGLNGHTIATNQIKRFADLARALGVNTATGKVAQAHTAFDKAAANLHTAAAKQKGLRILVVSGNKNDLYVAKTNDYGDLSFFKQRGVPLVSASTSKAYWDTLSWEQANKYPVDGILYDARTYAMPVADAKKIPTFAALPAVQAGQIGAWHADVIPTYQAYAKAMNELATTIKPWKALT